MPIYSLSYSSHEDSAEIYLEHEKDFTKEEFYDIMVKAIVDYYTEVKNAGPKERVNLGVFVSDEWPSASNISQLFWKGAIDKYITRYGFKVIIPKHNFCLSGWTDPFNFDDEHNWVNETDTETNLLMSSLREAGFTVEEDSYTFDRDRQYELDIRNKNKDE